jgi:hypothetical protein
MKSPGEWVSGAVFIGNGLVQPRGVTTVAWLRLTQVDGSAVLVNMGHVRGATRNLAGGSILEFPERNYAELCVVEELEEIEEMLKKAASIYVISQPIKAADKGNTLLGSYG